MEKMRYKISSRATILLGRESVSKVDGAIIELVKNAYDADAELCFLCFDIDNDCIYILDNGIGMTKEIIESCWMLIGTDNKRDNFRSGKNRIKSGEKGIGRFALDRLGRKCEMYTRSKLSPQTIFWSTNWEAFEQTGKTLDEIDALFEYVEGEFIGVVPYNFLTEMTEMTDKNTLLLDNNFSTGTLLKISGLRDSWSETEISKIVASLGFLIPPVEQKGFFVCLKESMHSQCLLIQNDISDEYDYKMSAEFNGERFKICLERNEFDLNKIPKAVFSMKQFQEYPYRLVDFKKEKFDFDFEISNLMKTDDVDIINAVKGIGPFEFSYTFMKITLQDDSKDTFFYKTISKNRKLWLEQHGGIKIYRDNFIVRPYGDVQSDSFDWLGLDARKSKNPAAISSSSGNWSVRNKQGQGTLFISRINNTGILDKSSREGLIDNNQFTLIKEALIAIISIFEQDRAYIGRVFKEYSDVINEKANTRQIGKKLAEKILEENALKSRTDENTPEEQVKTLAKAVQYFEEEREELITEVKLLRSLATNGLITTSIVHDLKSINALLVNRVNAFEYAIKSKNNYLISRNIDDLRNNDIFLKSWISIITSQIKKDKRKRMKKDLYKTISEIIEVMNPILLQKQINIQLECDENVVQKNIFVADFEAIIYNLIINSIEALSRAKILKRSIRIILETNSQFVIHYLDNGCGISEIFSNPYEIFDFGTTSKRDKNGEVIGTGLGMYIVASTAREYNAQYKITEYKNGFGMDIVFPL